MMVILQVQSVSSTWREVARVRNDSTIIAKRLDQLVIQYKKPVRAVDANTKALIDMRLPS